MFASDPGVKAEGRDTASTKAKEASLSQSLHPGIRSITFSASHFPYIYVEALDPSDVIALFGRDVEGQCFLCPPGFNIQHDTLSYGPLTPGSLIKAYLPDLSTHLPLATWAVVSKGVGFDHSVKVYALRVDQRKPVLIDAEYAATRLGLASSDVVECGDEIHYMPDGGQSRLFHSGLELMSLNVKAITGTTQAPPSPHPERSGMGPLRLANSPRGSYRRLLEVQ
ncbi:hypothetical protein NMY22_g4919 [Coprinellus aureogranulatus]|nr:hypothetical protein NMY22_g4919 [Coprinellus aureogranulatus]